MQRLIGKHEFIDEPVLFGRVDVIRLVVERVNQIRNASRLEMLERADVDAFDRVVVWNVQHVVDKQEPEPGQTLRWIIDNLFDIVNDYRRGGYVPGQIDFKCVDESSRCRVRDRFRLESSDW